MTEEAAAIVVELGEVTAVLGLDRQEMAAQVSADIKTASNGRAKR